MILYNAGNLPGARFDPLYYGNGMRHRLLSYAFHDKLARDSFAFWVGDGPRPGSRVFLDSGAFSARTLGIKIDLGAYSDFIRSSAGAVTAYAALDVIKDWKASASNLAAMHAMGLDPIPTFHRGSPWDVLDGLAADHGYVALGGVVSDRQGPDVLQAWLDECWSVLEPHWPVKVHVFGMQAQWALERYPFYSADSSAVIISAAMGRVSAFDRGRWTSTDWADYARSRMDGSVADGLGRLEGKSDSAHVGRGAANLAAMAKLERYVTDLWASKGVRWDS